MNISVERLVQTVEERTHDGQGGFLASLMDEVVTTLFLRFLEDSEGFAVESECLNWFLTCKQVSIHIGSMIDALSSVPRIWVVTLVLQLFTDAGNLPDHLALKIGRFVAEMWLENPENLARPETLSVLWDQLYGVSKQKVELGLNGSSDTSSDFLVVENDFEADHWDDITEGGHEGEAESNETELVEGDDEVNIQEPEPTSTEAVGEDADPDDETVHDVPEGIHSNEVHLFRAMALHRYIRQEGLTTDFESLVELLIEEISQPELQRIPTQLWEALLKILDIIQNDYETANEGECPLEALLCSNGDLESLRSIPGLVPLNRVLTKAISGHANGLKAAVLLVDALQSEFFNELLPSTSLIGMAGTDEMEDAAELLDKNIQALRLATICRN